MKLFIFILATLLSGCATYQQPVSRMPFPEQEYQSLQRSGNATIRGQAFLKTRGGDVKTAAGNEVFLNPVTSYSIEWYEKAFLGRMNLEPNDSRLDRYIKTQTADGSGRFTFKNVPPGDYFVTSVIQWEVPTGYQGALEKTGGSVTKRITVNNDDDLDIVITR